MKAILPFLTATMFFINGYTQPISGVIRDSNTKETLGYATIGVVGKNIGTAANAKGEFTLNLKDAENLDLLKISFIGYKSQSYNIRDFKTAAYRKEYIEVLLVKDSYILSSITIKPSSVKSVKVGSGLKIPGNVECFKTDISTEIGAYYKTKRAFVPTKVMLKIRSCSFDSAILALHVYQVGKDSSLLEVMTKQALRTIHKTSKKIEVEFDLKGSISKELKGSYVVSFSLVSVHGNGKIVLPVYYGNGFWRKFCESEIERIPAKVGLSIEGFLKN